MPIDKNKILRYQVLNRCFQDTSQLYRIGDLLKCCNNKLKQNNSSTVSRRTVQLDVLTLRETFGVEFDPELLKQHYYRYADVTTSLSLLELAAPDESALYKTINYLRKNYSDVENQNPQWLWMLTTLQAIADGRSLRDEYVSFENNSAFQGNVHFSKLFESILNHRPITLEYRPFTQSHNTTYHAHPYFLKQYNSRWFLFAGVDEHEGIMNFALDRIRSIRQCRRPFRKPTVDFDHYFDDVTGVSVNDQMPIEKIKLKVSSERYPYIDTKPFNKKHYELSHDSHFYVISFPMRVNNELVSKLLSYGSDVEVLQPESLRQRIAETVEKMSQNYSSAQKDCAKKE